MAIDLVFRTYNSNAYAEMSLVFSFFLKRFCLLLTIEISAAWLPPLWSWSDLCGGFREVPRARPQEVRRREAHLLGQP